MGPRLPILLSGLLGLMAHLSRWLDTQGAGVADLDPVLVGRFLADRRAESYVVWRSAKGLAPLLRYLRGIDVVAVAVVAGPVTAAEALIEEFAVYLRSERGLAEATIRSYAGVAGLFLAAGPFAQDMTVLTASGVTGFMLVENAGRSVGSATVRGVWSSSVPAVLVRDRANWYRVGGCGPDDCVVAPGEGAALD